MGVATPKIFLAINFIPIRQTIGESWAHDVNLVNGVQVF